MRQAAPGSRDRSGGRERRERQRDRRAEQGGGDVPLVARERDQQAKEQRRERRVEPERGRVADFRADERADRRAGDPRDVQDDPGAEQHAAGEPALALGGDRPGFVHDELRMHEPRPQGPGQVRRHRDPDRRVPRIQEQRRRHRARRWSRRRGAPRPTRTAPNPRTSSPTSRSARAPEPDRPRDHAERDAEPRHGHRERPHGSSPVAEGPFGHDQR